MPADARTSDGAARERRAFRDHLKRRIASPSSGVERQVLEQELEWVQKRQSRYDVAEGGLGRKLGRR